jgi:hypothetical protein
MTASPGLGLEAWIQRGKVAANKGLFLAREQDLADADFTMDKVASEFRRAAVPDYATDHT